MKKLMERYLFWIGIVLLVAYAAWSSFYGLTDVGVYDWDEARHGVSAYEMMTSGDYVVNTFDGEPDYWNVKPPLSMWIEVLGFRLFGPGLMGLRFFSAALLPVIVAVAMLFLKRYVGTVAALTTGFLFASTGTRMIHLYRTGDPDTLFIFFCLLAVIFLYMACKGNARWLVGAGVCTAFAFLAKSLHVVVLFAAIAATLLALRKQRRFSAKELLLYLVLPMALPVLIWAGLRISRDGLYFFQQMFVLDMLNRVTTVVENNTGGLLYYPSILHYLLGSWLFFGLILLNIIWLVIDLTNSKRPRNDRMLLVVFGSLFTLTLLIYTLSTTKLGWYIYPCLIGLFTVTGYAVQRTVQWMQGRKKRVSIAIFMSFGLLLVAIGGFRRPPYLTDHIAMLSEQSSDTSVFKPMEGQTVLPGYVVCQADGSPDTLPQSWLCHALFLGTTHLHGGPDTYIRGESYIILKYQAADEKDAFAAAHSTLQPVSSAADAYGYRYELYQ